MVASPTSCPNLTTATSLDPLLGQPAESPRVTSVRLHCPPSNSCACTPRKLALSTASPFRVLHADVARIPCTTPSSPSVTSWRFQSPGWYQNSDVLSRYSGGVAWGPTNGALTNTLRPLPSTSTKRRRRVVGTRSISRIVQAA